MKESELTKFLKWCRIVGIRFFSPKLSVVWKDVIGLESTLLCTSLNHQTLYCSDRRPGNLLWGNVIALKRAWFHHLVCKRKWALHTLTVEGPPPPPRAPNLEALQKEEVMDQGLFYGQTLEKVHVRMWELIHISSMADRDILVNWQKFNIFTDC